MKELNERVYEESLKIGRDLRNSILSNFEELEKELEETRDYYNIQEINSFFCDVFPQSDKILKIKNLREAMNAHENSGIFNGYAISLREELNRKMNQLETENKMLIDEMKNVCSLWLNTQKQLDKMSSELHEVLKEDKSK